jgi:hypothetical protein
LLFTNYEGLLVPWLCAIWAHLPFDFREGHCLGGKREGTLVADFPRRPRELAPLAVMGAINAAIPIFLIAIVGFTASMKVRMEELFEEENQAMREILRGEITPVKQRKFCELVRLNPSTLKQSGAITWAARHCDLETNELVLKMGGQIVVIPTSPVRVGLLPRPGLAFALPQLPAGAVVEQLALGDGFVVATGPVAPEPIVTGAGR